jgi:hypothetical protein
MTTTKIKPFDNFEPFELNVKELTLEELPGLLEQNNPIWLPKSQRQIKLIRSTFNANQELEKKIKLSRPGDIIEALDPTEFGGIGIVGGDTFFQKLQIVRDGTNSITAVGLLDSLIQELNTDYIPFGYGLGINKDNLESIKCDNGLIELTNETILSQEGLSNLGQMILTTNNAVLAKKLMQSMQVDQKDCLILEVGEPLNNVLAYNGPILIECEGGTEKTSKDWKDRIGQANPNAVFGTIDIIQSGDSMRNSLKGNQEIVVKTHMPNFVVTRKSRNFNYDINDVYNDRQEYMSNQLRLRNIDRPN